MIRFKTSEIAAAIGANGEHCEEKEITAVTLDSREAGEGTLFIAIAGENFDGHDYIDSALAGGAAAAVSMRPEDEGKPNVLVVKDTEQALCDVAKAHRQKFDLPLVGVTGSVGKTTTKEMIACVLATKYQVKKTEANHNNQIGMPKTLLELSEQDTAAVMEMGTQGPGEIRQLTTCALPSVAVITKIGVSHIERFGSREAILKGKLEITEGLSSDGTLVLNADDPYLRSAFEEVRKKHRLITFGVDSADADLRAKEISGGASAQSFILCYGNLELPVYLPVGGLHSVYDALAAMAVGLILGVDPKEGVKALGRYEPSGMRQRMRSVAGRTFIEDCYNASPDSMEAALRVLARHEGSPRIAVLADMLELGEISESAHGKVGALAASLQVDLVLCVGEWGKQIARAAEDAATRTRGRWFETREALDEAIVQAAVPGSVVLFKGSRGMHLEQDIAAVEKAL